MFVLAHSAVLRGFCMVRLVSINFVAYYSLTLVHDACVRDVSWHPYENKIVSSSVSTSVSV